MRRAKLSKTKSVNENKIYTYYKPRFNPVGKP